jgi:hypothetical protein
VEVDVPFVSLTRLRLRSRRFLPGFSWHTWRSVRQLKRSAGFRTGALGRDADGGLWTITVWDDEGAMRAYRNTGSHMKAMPKLIGWCDEAAIAHWERDGAGLPDPAEALERMRDTGRLSKVRHPSPAHAARETAPTREAPRILSTFG